MWTKQQSETAERASQTANRRRRHVAIAAIDNNSSDVISGRGRHATAASDTGWAGLMGKVRCRPIELELKMLLELEVELVDAFHPRSE